MILPDVNLLVLAHRGEQARHEDAAAWLSDLINGESAFAMSELVLAGVVRVVTNPRIFAEPSPMADALTFARQLVEAETCVRLRPGPRHFAIFTGLCEDASARGNLVADAYHAALAIEHGCEWQTRDRDFARFPGLRWSDPLAG